MNIIISKNKFMQIEPYANVDKHKGVHKLWINDN
jgi:hypothetical protein